MITPICPPMLLPTKTTCLPAPDSNAGTTPPWWIEPGTTPPWKSEGRPATPPWQSEPRPAPTQPAAAPQQAWDGATFPRNCWDPRSHGVDIQLPSPDSPIQ
ncbi:MAG: hypothetical protein JWM90_1961 [Thermoleophilia bacterium]|nr:hypothetical protein [Thermoleophilia bacterium]